MGSILAWALYEGAVAQTDGHLKTIFLAGVGRMSGRPAESALEGVQQRGSRHKQPVNEI